MLNRITSVQASVATMLNRITNVRYQKRKQKINRARHYSELQTTNYKLETIPNVFSISFSTAAFPSLENCLLMRFATMALMLKQ